MLDSLIRKTTPRVAVVFIAVSLSSAAFAEEYTGNKEILFQIPVEASPDSFAVGSGCEFGHIWIDGESGVFLCPTANSYEVSYVSKSGESLRLYAHVRQHVLPGLDRMRPALHIGEYEARETPAAPSDDGDGQDGLASVATGAKRTILVKVPNAIGAVSFEGSISAKPQGGFGSDAVLINGTYTFTGPAPHTFDIVAVRNDACRQTVDVDVEGVEGEILTFETDCRIASIALPRGVIVSAPRCEVRGVRLDCLVEKSVTSLSLRVEGWGQIPVAIDGANGGKLVPTRLTRADIPIDPLLQQLEARTKSFCDGSGFRLEFTGYCAAGDSASCVSEERSSIETDGLPSLIKTKWGLDTFPAGFQLALTLDGDVIDTVVVPIPTPIDVSVTDLLLNAKEPRFPLPLGAGIAGQELLTYDDAQCSTPVTDRVSLGEGQPQTVSMPSCGSARLFEGGAAVSRCTPLTFDPDRRSFQPFEARGNCGDGRVVVLVAQNASLNGARAEAVLRAIDDTLADFRSSEMCVSVDFATSQNERRTLLFDANEIFNSPGDRAFNIRSSMQFVSSRSEILRDFSWIWREWKKDMRALILVGDGTQVFADDMTASAEALAWHILEARAVMLDLAGGENCKVFTEHLQFDDCRGANAEDFAELLDEEMTNALGALQ